MVEISSKVFCVSTSPICGTLHSHSSTHTRVFVPHAHRSVHSSQVQGSFSCKRHLSSTTPSLLSWIVDFFSKKKMNKKVLQRNDTILVNEKLQHQLEVDSEKEVGKMINLAFRALHSWSEGKASLSYGVYTPDCAQHLGNASIPISKEKRQKGMKVMHDRLADFHVTLEEVATNGTTKEGVVFATAIFSGKWRAVEGVNLPEGHDYYLKACLMYHVHNGQFADERMFLESGTDPLNLMATAYLIQQIQA